MTIILFALAALAWLLLVALPVALLVGRAVRLRDRVGPVAGSRDGRKAA